MCGGRGEQNARMQDWAREAHETSIAIPSPYTHNILQLCADALAEARKMAEETKKMYNPMNQPLVKNLLSQVQ